MDPRCQQLRQFHVYSAVICQTVVAALMILRTYALYNRSRRVLVGLVVCGLILLSVALVAASVPIGDNQSHTIDNSRFLYPAGCSIDLTVEEGRHHAVGWIMMTCMDTVIFALTLVKVVELGHVGRQGLLKVFWRDGAMYYAILIAANFVNVYTLMASHVHDSDRGITTTLVSSLSTILVARVFLNIRDPHLSGRAQGSEEWPLSERSLVSGETGGRTTAVMSSQWLATDGPADEETGIYT
ncbi:hypothetical protein C8Q76DRAFT_108453 [Earliella scabrosa]|nr:hypothetical protein C8Q76DRAFT_108453 [Earliella scabrosa]